MIRKSERIVNLWSRVVEEKDPRAFEEFFYLLNSRLIRFSIFYVHKREIAEELVSDVFVDCWAKAETLRHVKNPETYLFICVKNRSLNYSKRYSSIHLVDIDENSAHLVDYFSPEKELEKKELMHKLDQAVDGLPRQCKIIFKLVKDEGMKYKEVGEILDISPKTVQTQLLRAMKKLNTTMLPYLRPGVQKIIETSLYLVAPWVVFF